MYPPAFVVTVWAVAGAAAAKINTHAARKTVI